MKHSGALITLLFCCGIVPPIFAQVDPASEPTVLAVSEATPAVVNINTGRVVRRRLRDVRRFCRAILRQLSPRPREIRQTLQPGFGFIVDPAGFIVTNQRVVERAADLKISDTE
jgi:S1-C subfamily serine protease